MSREAEARSNIFLNSGIICWVLMLITLYRHDDAISIVFFFLLFLFFSLHVYNIRIIKMFRKLKSGGAGVNIPEPTDLLVPRATEGIAVTDTYPPVKEDKATNTVIASGVYFEGDIKSGGVVYIYGNVIGNIESKEGVVKVMRNGLVEGNIRSRELIVDGKIKGVCQAESIDVCENGCIDGALSYSNLAVKKGGVLTGQVSLLNVSQPIANIVDLKNDATTPQAKPAKDKKTAN